MVIPYNQYIKEKLNSMKFSIERNSLSFIIDIKAIGISTINVNIVNITETEIDDLLNLIVTLKEESKKVKSLFEINEVNKQFINVDIAYIATDISLEYYYIIKSLVSEYKIAQKRKEERIICNNRIFELLNIQYKIHIITKKQYFTGYISDLSINGMSFIIDTDGHNLDLLNDTFFIKVYQTDGKIISLEAEKMYMQTIKKEQRNIIKYGCIVQYNELYSLVLNKYYLNAEEKIRYLHQTNLKRI